MYEDDYFEYEDDIDEDYYDEEPEEDETIRCANCGVVIENPEEAIKVEKYGEIYYFCSEECKEEYGF